MGISYNPSISTNGLVLALDAANRKSYPGSGTTWFDLSGNENHFTLYNSPTLTNNGFTFNGTNQYAQCVNTTCGNFGSSSYTIEYAVNYTAPAASSVNCFLMKRGGITSIGQANNPGWAHRVGASVFFAQDDNPGGVQSNIINLSVTNNSPNISYYTVVITRNGLGITTTVYLNNVQIATSTTTMVGTGSVFNATAMNLFYTTGENVYMAGNMYFTRMYNRALSTAEVQQNFNAYRGRFNI